MRYPPRPAPPYGRVHLAPAADMPVAHVGTWTITYLCGAETVKTGGSVLFIIPLCGWSSPKLFPPEEPRTGIMDSTVTGLVWAECSRPDVELALRTEVSWEKQRSPEGARLWLWPGNPLEALVTAGTLAEGDMVVLTYGDAGSGSPGAVAGIYAARHEFPVFVDPDGARGGPCGGFFPVGDPPAVRCLPREPRKLVVTAPSRVEAGRAFDVGVVPRDRYENAVCAPPRTVSLAGDSWDVVAVGEARLGGEAGMTAPEAARIKTPGAHRIIVRDRETGLEGASNPVEVVPPGPHLRIFWGDLHVHSSVSDGLGTPEEAYRYARDVAMIDFAALADHDSMMTQGVWEGMRQAAAEANEPGRFVAFSAYEYSERKHGGDKNVYYLSDDQPMFRSQEAPHDTPAGLFEALRGREALVIPHHSVHPSMTTHWEHHDPDLMRLVEVYSSWGNSEYAGNPRPLTWDHQHEFRLPPDGSTVQDGLARGLRLGLMCSSDNHSGQPGYNDVMGGFGRRRAYHGGIIAVLAPELTREALWDALRRRLCYGTTGARMILHLEVDGEPMGSELVRAPGRELALRAHVIGTERIDAFELVRNNETLFAVESETERADIEEPITVPDSGCDYYYVRVMQADGELGWAGPVWVEAGG